MPRAHTVEECREMLFRHLLGIADYWAEVGMTRQEVARGVLHSVFVTFDGGSSNMPAFDIVPSPHPSDKAYHKDQGENYWPTKVIINECQLHDMLSAVERGEA